MSEKTFEPRKIGVWTEANTIKPRELIIPVKTDEDSTDDIQTLPDIDDFQEILERDLYQPPKSELTDKETANTLAEVGGGVTSNIEGMDGVLEVLKSFIPQVEADTSDTVWTIDTLLTELS